MYSNLYDSTSIVLINTWTEKPGGGGGGYSPWGRKGSDTIRATNTYTINFHFPLPFFFFFFCSFLFSGCKILPLSSLSTYCYFSFLLLQNGDISLTRL